MLDRLVYALGAVLAFASAGCGAENIQVRAISAKDGRPLAERRVQLFCARAASPGERQGAVVFNQWAYTNGEGAATFNIDEPIPIPGAINVGGIAGDWCSPATYSTEQVLKTGVSIEGSCPHRPKGKFTVRPHPGEIVIYIGEYSTWERMLYLPWPS